MAPPEYNTLLVRGRTYMRLHAMKKKSDVGSQVRMSFSAEDPTSKTKGWYLFMENVPGKLATDLDLATLSGDGMHRLVEYWGSDGVHAHPSPVENYPAIGPDELVVKSGTTWPTAYVGIAQQRQYTFNVRLRIVVRENRERSMIISFSGTAPDEQVGVQRVGTVMTLGEPYDG